MRALSWGCGTQSTALAVMSALGELPKLDVIITADTQWERRETYEIRNFYRTWLQKRGIHVEVVTAGNIRLLGAREHIHIPFWTDRRMVTHVDPDTGVEFEREVGGGPLRRQCTRHFKIIPVKRRLRELAGYDATKAPHPPAGEIELWLGISWDEFTRMKKSRVQFIRHRWPLIERKITRNACIDYLSDKGLSVPPKSACIGCPYRSASEWLEMRDEAPDEWREVVEFDERNRHNPLAERGGSTSDELYVYKRAVPLRTADLEEDAAREQQGKQLPLMVCESGYCMV